MVSNGGPEEDSTVGVWKSLLEWECRAWGSTQRSAPETATGPSCHVHRNAQGDPARQIYQPHTHSHSTADTLLIVITEESYKDGIFLLEHLLNLSVGEFNLLCLHSCCNSCGFCGIFRKGYLRLDNGTEAEPRRQQKQKTWKKCSISNLLQTAPGI